MYDYIPVTNHFLERVKERFGLCVDKKDCLKIIEDIQNKNCIFIGKNKGSNIFLVYFLGRDVYVVADRRGVLITALTKEYARHYWKKPV